MISGAVSSAVIDNNHFECRSCGNPVECRLTQWAVCRNIPGPTANHLAGTASTAKRNSNGRAYDVCRMAQSIDTQMVLRR